MWRSPALPALARVLQSSSSMTDYTAAHATVLVAVFCACCARPLVDAESVETGVGPECRRRHGYKRAESAPAWDLVRELLAAHLETLAMPAGWDQDQRRAANVLVHRIACEQDGELVLACVNALRALGFEKLADRMADRLAKITLRIEGSEIVIKAPYSEALFAIPGRRYDRAEGVTRVAVRSSLEGAKAAVEDALTRGFPGAVVRGPKGLFALDRA